MEERPTFRNIFVEMAHLIAKRSTCSRLQVGTVITSVDHRYVYAIGYNGNATGLANQCDSTEVGHCGCIHSEANAVINCNVNRCVRKIVYCTHLSCVMCAKMLVNLGGVQKLVYCTPYRLHTSLEVFRQAKIPVDQILGE